MVRTNKMTALRGFLGASLLALSFNAEAAPLDLTLFDTPDIASFFINVSYDSGAGSLMATGFALRYDAAAEASFGIANGLYTLQANIDNSGALLDGTITIRGTIAAAGFTSGTLLTGTLTDFGFGNSDVLEFLFTPTGGDLASQYGDKGGIIMAQTGFNGTFTENFGNSTGVADVAAVPVPAAVWLMFSALAGLVGIRRRR